MPYNIRIVTTFPPRRCGIGTFSRDLSNALEHFTSEVGNIRISAIDHQNLPYSIPVDLVIDQYSPKSWDDGIKDIITRANEGSNPTVVLLQHEYGLDPDEKGENGRGYNYVNMAKRFKEKGLTTLVYLHTVLDQPDEHQKKTIQDLAKYSDGVIVTTESAVDILESPLYGIKHEKLKHIDHGIRMQHPSQYDRLAIKEEFGLKGKFIISTLGLLSPGKGIQYSIAGYGRFLTQFCTEEQRKNIVYLIAGECHPDFVRNGGQDYLNYVKMLNDTLENAKLKWCKTKHLPCADFEKYDVVFLETFLDEATLLKLYGATNAMVLPYLNMQQISSGILADTVGAGRVAVTTKFRYALELIYSNKQCPPGLIIGRYARGILVDPGEPSVEQIAKAIDYLVFNQDRRLIMERQTHQRGYQMRWDNTAWALLQQIDFIREQQRLITGRGIKFTREKPSEFHQDGR